MLKFGLMVPSLGYSGSRSYFWITDLLMVEVESLMWAETLNMLVGLSLHQAELPPGDWVVEVVDNL